MAVPSTACGHRNLFNSYLYCFTEYRVPDLQWRWAMGLRWDLMVLSVYPLSCGFWAYRFSLSRGRKTDVDRFDSDGDCSLVRKVPSQVV